MSNISIKYCELSLCTKVSSLAENYDVEIGVLAFSQMSSYHIILHLKWSQYLFALVLCLIWNPFLK